MTFRWVFPVVQTGYYCHAAERHIGRSLHTLTDGLKGTTSVTPIIVNCPLSIVNFSTVPYGETRYISLCACCLCSASRCPAALLVSAAPSQLSQGESQEGAVCQSLYRILLGAWWGICGKTGFLPGKTAWILLFFCILSAILSIIEIQKICTINAAFVWKFFVESVINHKIASELLTENPKSAILLSVRKYRKKRAVTHFNGDPHKSCMHPSHTHGKGADYTIQGD